jgi:hypothetical protein
MIIHNPILTGSLSLNGVNLTTSNLVTTGSNTFSGSQVVSGSITTTGTLTAQTLVVQTITSSVDYITGSSINGSLLSNTHQITGSVGITGSIDLRGTGSLGDLKVYNSVSLVDSFNGNTQSWIWSSGIPGSIAFGTGSITLSNAKMFISSSGNVGIGTNTPIAPLHIYSSNQTMASSAATSYSNAKFRLEPYYNSSVGISMGLISPNVNYLQSVYNDGTTAPFVIQPYGGSVGIGLTNPSYKLSISGSLQLQSNNTTPGAPIIDIYDNGRSQETVISSYDGTTVGTYIASYSNHPLMFGAYANSTPTAKMTILANGNVGIGTVSPSYNLDVTGSIRAFNGTAGGTAEVRVSGAGYGGSYNSTLRSITGAVGVLQLGNNADNYIIGGNGTAGGFLIFRVNAATESIASGREAMRITSGGNVGINDPSPATTLSIAGANYVEMATFACTTAGASAIVTNNTGYVQFSLSNARHCSNSSLFVPTTDGIQITKAGIIHVQYSQDITTTSSTGYVSSYIQKNKATFSENLISNTNGQWDGISGCGTIDVAANDVINFLFSAGDITAFDPNGWSQYSFIWTSR